MKYRVSRCPDNLKKRKLKGCSTWVYKTVDTKEEADKLAKEWKQLGFYIKVEEDKSEQYVHKNRKYDLSSGKYIKR